MIANQNMYPGIAIATPQAVNSSVPDTVHMTTENEKICPKFLRKLMPSSSVSRHIVRISTAMRWSMLSAG